MVAFMEAHNDLCMNRIQTIEARRASNNLWQQLTADLNAEGPPTKSCEEWKKVLK